MKVQFKITTWEEVEVPDYLYDEVVDKIKSSDIRTSNDLFDEYEDIAIFNGVISDTDVQMTVSENEGNPTIEVMVDKELKFDNSKIK